MNVVSLPDKISTKNLTGDRCRTFFNSIIFGTASNNDDTSDDDEFDDASKAIEIDGTSEGSGSSPEDSESDNARVDELARHLSKLSISYDVCEGISINFESRHALPSNYGELYIDTRMETCPYLRLCNISPSQLAQVNKHLKRCV